MVFAPSIQYSQSLFIFIIRLPSPFRIDIELEKRFLYHFAFQNWISPTDLISSLLTFANVQIVGVVG